MLLIGLDRGSGTKILKTEIISGTVKLQLGSIDSLNEKRAILFIQKYVLTFCRTENNVLIFCKKSS